MFHKSTFVIGVALIVIAAFCVETNEGVGPTKPPAKQGKSISGGFSKEKPADDKIKKIVETLKEELKAKIEKKNKEKVTNITALVYSSQVVAGTNHLVKIRAAGSKPTYWHVKIFQPLGKKPAKVTEVHGPKGEKDKLH